MDWSNYLSDKKCPWPPYVYLGMMDGNLYDLSPLSELCGLKELFISNGGMSGVGRPVKSMEFLCNLTDLEYLHFGVTVEGRSYDISPILGLHKLRELHLLPRFLKNGAADIIKQHLPQLNW